MNWIEDGKYHSEYEKKQKEYWDEYNEQDRRIICRQEGAGAECVLHGRFPGIE